MYQVREYVKKYASEEYVGQYEFKSSTSKNEELKHEEDKNQEAPIEERKTGVGLNPESRLFQKGLQKLKNQSKACEEDSDGLSETSQLAFEDFDSDD